ncbi:MAG: hypothetical protein ACFE8B_10965 [Candidatus Hermodarchaeota archaeon]
MNDKDLERIEKKIDLLFKILLELNVEHIGYPYDFKYLSNHGEEIRAFYSLDIEKERHRIQFPSKKEVDETQTKLEKLQKKYTDGDYLAKEKQEIEDQIKSLEEKLEEFEKFNKNRKIIEEALIKVNNELFKIETYLALRRELGLSEKPKMSYTLDWWLNHLAEILEISKKGEDPRYILRELGI